MKYRIARLLLLFLVCATLTIGQNPPEKQQQPEKTQDTVIITTNLVQMDAVVTDKNGRPVADLKPEDFEVLENGHVRPITSFSYVSLTSKALPVDSAVVNRNAEHGGPPNTLHAIRPETVRRAIAIVVDDFGLSFESIARLRSALEKFIEEQTLDTDLMAVIRTSGGPGMMQQFTSNRTQIMATIKRLQWYSTGRGGMSAVEPFSPIDNNENGVEIAGYSSSRPPDLSSKEFSGGSLGSLSYVIHGLSRFPGRKSIVLISENVPLTKEAQINGVTQVLDKLIELANRNSIVISTIDARGLRKAGLTADDSQTNLAANQINNRSRERTMKFVVQQDALSYLAGQTGGKFVHDNTDLTNALDQVVESEQGYYLLGYRPDDDETAGKSARERTYKVSLRLKRPGLELRTRSSFHRTALARDIDAPVKEKETLLREALTSPFVKEDLHLKMTALFTGGSQIKVLLHIDARDIEFVKTPDENYTASFDIAVVAFDDNGKVAKQMTSTQPLHVPANAYEQLLRDGIIYSITAPMVLPGAYQVRVALRDQESGRLGSDSQFVEVPDVKKLHLKVAGFVVQRINPLPMLQHTAETSRLPIEGISGTELRKGPAVRRFDVGDLLNYSYLIYGARQNSETGSPTLTSQIRLFRGDKEVFTSKVTPITISQDPNRKLMIAQGTLKLGTNLVPGEYFLQVIVTDQLAPIAKQVTDEWIDFEILK